MAQTSTRMIVTTRDTLNLTDRREDIGRGGVVTIIDGTPRRRVAEERTRRTECNSMVGRVIWVGIDGSDPKTGTPVEFS